MGKESNTERSLAMLIARSLSEFETIPAEAQSAFRQLAKESNKDQSSDAATKRSLAMLIARSLYAESDKSSNESNDESFTSKLASYWNPAATTSKLASYWNPTATTSKLASY